MNRRTPPILACAALALIAACADGRGGSSSASGSADTVSLGREGPLVMRPTRRDPQGYVGRPVDSSPTTTELEGGSSLPGARDQLGY